MPESTEDLGLNFNPFEPAASGPPVGAELWLPTSWQRRLETRLRQLSQGQGAKALPVVGEYGSGKTYLLQWLHQEWFPRRRIKPFYFDNPGVQFYDLANSLLRQIGRKNFAKSIWELASPSLSRFQQSLFPNGFEEYLRGYHLRGNQTAILSGLQSAIKAAGIASDDEIAHRLAKLVAETPAKPYFEYRDFIAGSRGALVAEREEAPYFAAILRTLQSTAGISAVAFLIDEFEEISLEKRLSRREAHDYLATLKRLINLSLHEDLWLIVAMTPDSVEKTSSLEPALWDRFTGQGRYLLDVPALEPADAIDLIRHRLNSAREGRPTPLDSLFPFPENLGAMLSPATLSSPRRLVKVCFYALSERNGISLPFSEGYLRGIEDKAYPSSSAG